jgi:hypothetical protein
MKQHFEILKRLIAEAEEETNVDAEASEEETVEEPKPGSFEADPMAFILKKYHSLNELLIELMTKDFAEYVDAIFVMAPKPTTFKIQLHNGQFFFLVYLGKAYEATIEGKKYYLMGIGEKERCMTAIARLLRFGTPLKTKGPEGAEQATREEDNTGMEGDWAANGGASGGMEPEAGAEAPPEESGTEELEENKRLLEALLMKEGSFSKEEEKLLKYAIDALKKDGVDSKRVKKSDTDPHIRGVFGDEASIINTIKSALGGKVKVEVVPSGNRSKGSQSDTYDTYKFTLSSNFQDIPKGSSLYVVNQVKAGKSTVAAKSLTPGAFGMNGKTYKTADSIVKTVDSSLKSMPNKELANALTLLMRDINTLKGQQAASVSEVKNYSKSVPLAKDTQKAISAVLPGDLAIVGKDFGEILGAILMAKEIKLKEGVTFPKGNEPLVDFYVDGYGISSKYKTGAAATLTNLVQQLDPAQLTTKEQKQLYKEFSEAFKLGVSDSYLKLAKKFAPQEVGALAYILGISEKNLTTQAINDHITQLMPNKAPKDADPKLDKKIEKEFDSFFAAAKSKPSFPIKWGSLTDNKLYGLVMGPLSAAVAKKLNSNPEYIKALKEMVGKVEIKQLYLDFDLKSNSMSFKLKSFADANAQFSFTPANISVYNPDNGKMGFKMK